MQSISRIDINSNEYKVLTREITAAAQKSFPIKSFKRFLKPYWNQELRNLHNAPLAAEGAMCIFHTFEKNVFKDFQPPEKSGLQYKSLVLILKIVYECIVLNETSLNQFDLEIKIIPPFWR